MATTERRAQFNIHEAKTHLSRLVERAAAGEEIIISKAGRPVARLGPIPRAVTPREPGHWRGRVLIHEDFDELPAELAAAFRGERPGWPTWPTTQRLRSGPGG
jgi:prevent-host-death family protein